MVQCRHVIFICCFDPQRRSSALDTPQVDMFYMNPIFRHMCGQFLLQCMHLMCKHSFFYALPAGQAPPEMIHEFTPVPQRHDLPLKDDEDAYALFTFTRKLAMRLKAVNNSRIVVVGPSEMSLACLEELLLQVGWGWWGDALVTHILCGGCFHAVGLFVYMLKDTPSPDTPEF